MCWLAECDLEHEKLERMLAKKTIPDRLAWMPRKGDSHLRYMPLATLERHLDTIEILRQRQSLDRSASE